MINNTIELFNLPFKSKVNELWRCTGPQAGVDGMRPAPNISALKVEIRNHFNQ